MGDEEERRFVVFYAWQSDLPPEHNRRLIREALRTASSRLEEERGDINLRVDIDEATRGKSGSPNIPLTIFEKIEGADAFVCDITTINSSDSSGWRKVPNPNVLIELGYAIAHLGWERIVMLFNTEYGTFPDDAPFDIDRHRASPFSFLPKSRKPTKKELRSLKEPLFTLMHEALRAILENDPARPLDDEMQSPEAIERRHDVETVKALLSSMHIPSLDLHIAEAPHLIRHEIFHFWETFHAIFTSSLFHLYDSKLRHYVTRIHDLWNTSISCGDRYMSAPGGRAYVFHNSGHAPLREEEQRDWNTMAEALVDLNKALRSFMTYLRENYMEIDIDSLSERSWSKYVDFMSDMRDKMGRDSDINE